MPEVETTAISVSLDTYEKLETMRGNIRRVTGAKLSMEEILKIVCPDLRFSKDELKIRWDFF